LTIFDTPGVNRGKVPDRGDVTARRVYRKPRSNRTEEWKEFDDLNFFRAVWSLPAEKNIRRADFGLLAKPVISNAADRGGGRVVETEEAVHSLK
jgi:hypothetical protein